MICEPTPLPGVFLVGFEPLKDVRGFFGRVFCEKTFREKGLAWRFEQTSASFNIKKGTVRGMHWQKAPHAEVKLVRCTRGRIFDVVLDLRPDSLTFKKSFGVELSWENRRQLYIPEGFAHGFQTLEDETEVFYCITPAYAPESVRGARWNDPQFEIRFPLPVSVISEKDAGFPDFIPDR